MNAIVEDLRAAIAAGEAQPEAPRVVLTQASTLKPEPIRWLWPGWLALGKLHVLAGAPGQGKTTLLLAFAATITSGGRWPDGSRAAPGSVLIWSGEDDPTDTLLPRLLAMGADATKVHFITGTSDDGTVRSFDPARDLVQLIAAAQRIGDVRMLMVDPVVSAVGGADSHKNTEVRRALQPLVDLAGAIDCAVVGISHFGKGTAGRDPTERVVGSVAFGAVARVVMVAAKVKTDEGATKRVLARSKSNIGADDGGFEYDIDQTELDAWPGIFASRIGWGQAVEGTARELLAESEAEPDSDADDAAGFLRGLLADGPVSAKQVLADASGAGYSRDQMQRAARRIGVDRRKTGMSGGWQWAQRPAEGGAEGSEDRGKKRVPPSPSSVPPSIGDSGAEDSREDSEDSHSGKAEPSESSAESSGAWNLRAEPSGTIGATDMEAF